MSRESSILVEGYRYTNNHFRRPHLQGYAEKIVFGMGVRDIWNHELLDSRDYRSVRELLR